MDASKGQSGGPLWYTLGDGYSVNGVLSRDIRNFYNETLHNVAARITDDVWQQLIDWGADPPSPPVRPPHDDFNGALDATRAPSPLPISGATTADDDPNFTCVSGQKYHTVWYKTQFIESGTLTVDTFGSEYDTVLAVWTGERGSLQSEGCNDDSDGTLQSRVEVPVSAGAWYYTEVASYSPADYNDPGMLHFSASLDSECTIGEAYLRNLADRWHEPAGADDCDGDGKITVVDIMCVAKRMGQSCTPLSTGAIVGYTTIGGEGVPNSTLFLYTSSGQEIGQTTSNSAGYYRFTDVPAESDYEIKAWFDPCHPDICGPEYCHVCSIPHCEIRGITVQEGRTTQVDIEWNSSSCQYGF